MKKNLIISIFAIIVLVGTIFFVQEKKKITQEKEGQVEVKKDDDASDNLKQKRMVGLGDVIEEEIFSVPVDALVPSFCPLCKEKNVDPINGYYWEFVVAPDYAGYAYILSKDGGEYLVLNGKNKKSYNDVYLLRFNPRSRDVSYHAFANNQTYLVYGDEEISVYPEREGFPQAINGVSESFSVDGVHLAYAKVEKNNPKLMHIILDGKEINLVEADSIVMNFRDDSVLEYIISVPDKNSYKRLHYEDSRLIGAITLDEENLFRSKSNYKRTGHGNIIEDKKILMDGFEVADYSKYSPEVFISDVNTSGSGDILYKLQTAEFPSSEWVSLNGNDSEFKYDDIRYINFSDNNSVIYVGRKGRHVYKITQSIIEFEN